MPSSRNEVWLRLKNIRTDRPSKKLDWKNAKYTITELIGTHAVRLDTPTGIHPVFHVELLRPAATDPLPSQVSDNLQPPAVMVDGEEEFNVKEILDEKHTKQGGGSQLEYKVKWTGYARPTWEGASALANTHALDMWEEHTSHAHQPNRHLDPCTATEHTEGSTEQRVPPNPPPLLWRHEEELQDGRACISVHPC